MTEPGWAKVLKTMHNAEYPSFDKPTNGRIGDSHLITAGAGLSESEGIQAIRYLRSANLIDDRDSVHKYYLTERGFEVAHKRELTEQQNRTNRLLAWLTVLLVGTAVVQAFSSILTLEGTERQIMMGFAAIVVLGIAISIKRSNRLEK